MESNRPMNCMLRVDTQSPGWEKSLTKVIKRVKDVSYSIDATHGIIHISGEIDPNKLLTEIKKAGKHAVLIQADCGGGHSHTHSRSNYEYGYDYDGGYAKLEPHSYPYYEAQPQPGLGYYFQSDPHRFNALPPPPPERNHAPLLPPPTAPPLPLDYDPHNPSCNLM